MAIEGSIVVNPAAAGPLVVSLPSSDLTIVGVFHNLPYLGIQLGPGKTAFLANLGTGYKRVIPVTFKPGTNQITINCPAPGNVVFYYGTPLTAAKSLDLYAGVVVTASPAAAGSGTLTVAFPKSGKLTGFTNYVTASYVELSWNVSTGKVLTFFDTSLERLENDNITALNVPIVDTLLISYTAGAALTFYAIFYYV